MLPSYGENIFQRTSFFPEYLIFKGSSPTTLQANEDLLHWIPINLYETNWTLYHIFFILY